MADLEQKKPKSNKRSATKKPAKAGKSVIPIHHAAIPATDTDETMVSLASDNGEEQAVETAEHNYLVGIGASAGGLEALTTMISALPTDLGISYVVIQHLSPTHRSMMVQLLGRETQLAVCEVTDGMRPEPDVIYVAPASHNLLFRDGLFHLVPTVRDALPKPSANVFFSSLAAEKGEDAIGVILSGTGSDGTVGLREIKAAGGFTFAQTPETAKYSGMPQSAIESGCVDWIMAPDVIAREIAIITRGRRPVPPQEQALPAATSLKRLLMMVKQQSRIDFSGYKEATLWRRIERRMAANHLMRFEDYLRQVERDPEELDKLAKDILISVTAFFRDAESFVHLKEVLSGIVSGKQPGDEIRIWVAGCATGEEAYSIAIMLSEVLGGNAGMYKIQIFATDIDNEAMNLARKGVYVEGALAELDPAVMSRYFLIMRGRYEIARPIRDMVVFARQDLVLDPPFLRLDMISCRNVLIYLKNELQAKVLSTFHYGLKPGGYLFLGKSEGVFQQESLFSPIEKAHRIYRRQTGEGRATPIMSRLPDFGTATEARRSSSEQRLIDAAVRNYVPASVLVTGSGDIQQIHGNVSDFLAVSSGKPSLNLQHLISRELRTDLQLLQHEAEKSKLSAYGRPRHIGKGDSRRHIRLAVHPLEPGVASQLFLVCFENIPAEEKVGAGETAPVMESRQDMSQLEDELVSTRERLQTVIEELETSNEELQALNEEVQAANEELQSSNEELEAANEELQSTNEELITVNEELQIRSSELAEALTSVERIQNSVGFPILVINQHQRLTRFNSPAAAVFSLSKNSLGQPISALRLPPGMPDFSAHIADALDRNLTIEAPIFSAERHYQLHISPFETLPAGRGAILTLVDDTERMTHERDVRTSQKRLMSIMNNSTSLITLKDLGGRYEFVNRKFEELFGLKAADVIGKTDNAIFPGRIADEFRAKELDAIRKKKPVEEEDHLYLADGEHFLLSIRFPLRDEEGVAYGVCMQATDVTQGKHAEHQLKLAARVFDRSSEGIVVTDPQQKILTINDAFTTVTGYSSEEVIGQTPQILNSGKHLPDFYLEMWEKLSAHGWWQGEIWNRRKNGEIYPEWLTINTVHDAEGKIINYIGIFSDISVVKDSQRRVEFLATHDELTALPNRTLFLDRMRQTIARAERGGTSFGILFIDLDNFKIVNDSLGHDAGDVLLKEVARRLRDCTRAADTVARFGGDEFAVLLEESTAAEADMTATRIRETLQTPIMIDGHAMHASASIGICLYPEDGAEAHMLLKNADAAMYQAKEAGKSGHHFFTQELRDRADERLRMETGLRTAIEHNQLVLYYQPQVELNSGTVIGVEALVRWQHPEQGMIAPDRFIPLAEKSQLIDLLGEWVMTEACRQLAAWRSEGLPIQQVSINISAEQFRRSDLVKTMKRLLALYHLPAKCVMLELTESALMIDAQHVLEILQQLKALGVGLSIDDFGTGFSSLSYLRRYPLDELKIDRSFVDDVTEKGDDQAIAQTILSMAATLKLTAVAEGIETLAQAELLRSMGCPIGQGYLFARPMPANEVSNCIGRVVSY